MDAYYNLVYHGSLARTQLQKDTYRDGVCNHLYSSFVILYILKKSLVLPNGELDQLQLSS